MLNYDTALEMLEKYGYNSISVHPFLYQSGDTFGVCYTYTDEDYGVLERIKICETLEELEDFLMKYQWFQQNGKKYHVRMTLDNYETINPKVIFLRNEKIMVEGEMFDIDNYDIREAQRTSLDDVSKVIYESGDLLLVYDEIKARQMQYLKNLIGLKNTLRTKYYDLQLAVDTYNKVKVERNLNLLPEVTDLGINDVMEVSAKEKYNMYIQERPTYAEAVDFLKEVWELNMTLELNMKYYEAQKEETDIRNEMKVVEQKLALMKELNDDVKPLFGVDLVSKFKKINKKCKAESNVMTREFIQEELDAVNRKYGMYEQIDLLYTSDYLREATQNTNYKELASKYAKGKLIVADTYKRIPLNEVAASLTIQYKEKLSVAEQAILVLYNNRKYRVIFDTILNIDNFEKLTAKQIIKKLNGIKNFSKIKSECYDSVKKRIDNPINATIKSSLFANYDFASFETFVTSIVNELSKIKDINNKMIINGDINMYLLMNKEKDLTKRNFFMVTNDLNSLYVKAKEINSMIGLTLLKEKTPVLYSPYYFDLGDIYSKDASPQMTINEMINFELLVDTSDIIINVDPNKNNVARYYSDPIVSDNLSIVDDIKMASKTTFCKFSFSNNIASEVVAIHQELAPDMLEVGAGGSIVNQGGASQDIGAGLVMAVPNQTVEESVNVDAQADLQPVVMQPVLDKPEEAVPVVEGEKQSNEQGLVDNVTNVEENKPVVEEKTETTVVQEAVASEIDGNKEKTDTASSSDVAPVLEPTAVDEIKVEVKSDENSSLDKVVDNLTQNTEVSQEKEMISNKNEGNETQKEEISQVEENKLESVVVNKEEVKVEKTDLEVKPVIEEKASDDVVVSVSEDDALAALKALAENKMEKMNVGAKKNDENVIINKDEKVPAVKVDEQPPAEVRKPLPQKAESKPVEEHKEVVKAPVNVGTMKVGTSQVKEPVAKAPSAEAKSMPRATINVTTPKNVVNTKTEVSKPNNGSIVNKGNVPKSVPNGKVEPAKMVAPVNKVVGNNQRSVASPNQHKPEAKNVAVAKVGVAEPKKVVVSKIGSAVKPHHVETRKVVSTNGNAVSLANKVVNKDNNPVKNNESK